MTDGNEKLNYFRARLNRKKKVLAMLEELRRQLSGLTAEEEALAGLRAKEQRDVDRLENGSLSAFFWTVFGDRQERLDKERTEAHAAAVKHDAVLRQLGEIRGEISSLENELAALDGAEADLEAALAERLRSMKAAGDARGEEICRAEERLAHVQAQEREADEALSAGSLVLFRISEIEDALSGAEGWGTFDLLGGGLLADIAKHSRLDEAQEKIEELQVLLGRYRTELADVTLQPDIQARIDGFLLFADYFFDGLFADWAVLDSIHSSQEQVASTRMQVEEVQLRLENMVRQLRNEENFLRDRLERMAAED